MASNITSSVRNFGGRDTLWGWPMTASPRPCSTENWAPVIEHGEDKENATKTCFRQRWSHAAFHITRWRTPRQTVPSVVVPATPVYKTTKRRGAMPWGIRERDGRLFSLQQTLTHLCVTSAADSAHHGSACIVTTEHMLTQTLTEVEIRRTDGSLHTYTCVLLLSYFVLYKCVLSLSFSVGLYVCCYCHTLFCISVFCICPSLLVYSQNLSPLCFNSTHINQQCSDKDRTHLYKTCVQ